jgi:hypothetical protein
MLPVSAAIKGVEKNPAWAQPQNTLLGVIPPSIIREYSVKKNH